MLWEVNVAGLGQRLGAGRKQSRGDAVVSTTACMPGLLIFKTYIPDVHIAKVIFFVCNHVNFHPNNAQSNNLWTIFLPSEWLVQERLKGNLSFDET